jgi:PAS domain S-box-containing protein
MNEQFVDVKWPVKDDPHTNVLLKDPSPRVFRLKPGEKDPFAHRVDKSGVTEWAEVPLVLGGKVIGKISADNRTSQRPIDDSEVLGLGVFAKQAAVTLEASRLLTDLNIEKQRLHGLSRAVTAVMSRLEAVPLSERLTAIAKHAAEILGAEMCGVFLVRREGWLTLEASFGHAEGGFTKGLELRIESGPGTGLTGHIAHSRKLFNKHGSDLRNHPAVKGERDVSPSGECYSLLAIPLFKASEGESKLLGLLRAANKKRDGRASLENAFDHTDEAILQVFADAVVVALESAQLVNNLTEERAFRDRLIECCPDGVIAVDPEGKVKVFNEKAERIQDLKADSVKGTSVENLYDTPQEARRIGRLLKERGRIHDEPSTVRCGKAVVPILLSAANLELNGQRLGSVGFFRPCQDIKETETRLNLLLQATRTLAISEDLGASLQTLAEQLVTELRYAFCLILLVDERQPEKVRVEAAYPVKRSDPFPFDPPLGELMDIDDWGLRRLLESNQPKVCRAGNLRNPPCLARLAEKLSLQPLPDVAIVPISLGNSVLGLILAGELRRDVRSTLEGTTDFVHSLAAQTARLISRLRGQATMRKVIEAAERVAAATTVDEVGHVLIERTRELFHADFVTFWPYEDGKFVPKDLMANIPKEILEEFRRSGPSGSGVTREVLKSETGFLWVSDINDPVCPKATRESLQAIRVRSFAGIVVRAGQEPVGVLYVSYARKRAVFGAKQGLESLARAAGMAIKRARLLEEVTRTHEAARQIVDVMAFGGADQALEAISQATRSLGHADLVELHYFPAEPGELPTRVVRAGVSRSEGSIEEQFVKLTVQEAEPLVIDSVATHPRLGGSGYFREQGVQSCLAVPVRARGETLGAMFILYRSAQTFTNRDLGKIRLVVDQAAVALRNARVFTAHHRQQEVLRELSRRLLGANGLQQTLEHAVDFVKGTLDVDACEAVLRMEDGSFVVKCAQGWSRDPKGTRLPQGIGSFTGYTILKGQVVYVRSFQDEQRFHVHGDLKEEGFSSGLSIPLAHGDTFGAMLLMSKTPRTFNDEERALCDVMGGQIAIALQAASHFEAARQQKDHVAAFLDCSKAITSSIGTDYKQVLQQILVHIARHFQKRPDAWILATIQRFEPLSQDLVFEAIHPPDEETEVRNKVGERLSTDRARAPEGKRGINGRTVHEMTGQLVGDVSVDPDYVVFSVRTKAAVTAPLLHQGRVVGVLALESDEDNGFDARDKESLEAIAGLVVIAQEKAWMLAQAERVKKAAGVVAGAAAQGAVRDALHEIVSQAKECAQCDLVTLYTSDPVSHRITDPPVHAGAFLGEHPDDLKGNQVLPTNSLVYRIMQMHQPYLVESVSQDAWFHDRQFAKQEQIESCAALPLRVKEGTVGVLFLNYRSRRTFDINEVAAFRLLADQASVAIWNARLLAEHERMERLFGSLLQKLTAPRSVQDIVQRVAEVAASTLGCEAGLVFVHREGRETPIIGSYPSDAGANNEVMESMGRWATLISGPAFIRDFQADPRFGRDQMVGKQTVRSAAIMPIIEDQRTIGAVLVFGERRREFGRVDTACLLQIASHTAAALQILETRALVGQRTAVAWMGIMSAIWRHTVQGHAIAIRDRALLAAQDATPTGAGERLVADLRAIASEAEKIVQAPTTAPLKDRRSLDRVRLDDIIRDWTGDVRQSEDFSRLQLLLRLNLPKDAIVLVDPAWLRRVFEIIVDNARKATASVLNGSLTISSRQEANRVIISFTDNGVGIPGEIREKLLQERISHPAGKGFGAGLLAAQLILEHFDGMLHIAAPGPPETTVAVSLPLERR